jgi:hypothetical protein
MTRTEHNIRREIGRPWCFRLALNFATTSS